MAIKPARAKSSANNAKPNLLDQIGQVWKDLVGGKFAGPKPAQKKPTVAPDKVKQAKTKDNKPAALPNSEPNAATKRRETNNEPRTKQVVVKTHKVEPNRLQAGIDLAKREARALVKESQRHVVSTTAQDRQTINKVGAALNDLRSGNFTKVGKAIVRSASSPQLANSRLRSLGSAMAHSGINGVNRVGETMKTVADTSDSLIHAVKGAPKFFTDTRDLVTGRTQTTKRNVAAGSFNGFGETLYGMAAGTVTSTVSQHLPGYGTDFINRTQGKYKQLMADGYRKEVKKHGVDPDSKGYQSSSNLASAITTVVVTVKGGLGGRSRIKTAGRVPAVNVPAATAVNLPKLNRLPGKNNIVAIARKPKNPTPGSAVGSGGGPGGTAGTGGPGGPGGVLTTGGSRGSARTGGTDRPGGISSGTSRGTSSGGSQSGNVATLVKPTQVPTTTPNSAQLVQNIQRLQGGQPVRFTRAKPQAALTQLPQVAKPVRSAPMATGPALPLNPKKPPSAPKTLPPLAHPTTPTKEQITQPIGDPAKTLFPTTKPRPKPEPQVTQPIGVPAQPLLPETPPQPHTAQPLGKPSSPAPKGPPVDPAQTARTPGDPAPSFPNPAPIDINPDNKPQRRGNGDPPLKPGGNDPQVQKSIQDWLQQQGAKNHGQRVADYSGGRMGRDEALSGLNPEDRARMQDALNQIDRMRVGGSSSASGASGGSHSAANVKEIWRRVDQAGGADAVSEGTLRQLKGVTEQALKGTDLTTAERGEFAQKLNDINQAQGQFHKARQADKNNPPVDTSTWNLPMGETVFGQQAAQPQWEPGRTSVKAANHKSAIDESSAPQGMQQNPYQPGESFEDARQRMGAAFNAKDYFAGSSTPRVSPDEPGSAQTPPGAQTGSVEDLIQSKFAELQSSFDAGDINQKTLTVRAASFAKKEMKTLADVDKFMAALASGSPEMVTASKDPDLKRSINKLQKEIPNAPQAAAAVAAQEQAVALRAAQAEAERAKNNLIKDFVSNIKNSSSLPDFLATVNKQFPWLGQEESLAKSEKRFQFEYGVDGSDRIIDAIQNKAESFAETATLFDVAGTLVSRLSDSGDRYKLQILNTLRKAADAQGNWPELKQYLNQRGVTLPSDEVIKMAIPTPVPFSGEDFNKTYDWEMSEGVAETLNPSLKKFFSPDSLPTTRQANRKIVDQREAILDMVKNPRAALAQAYPDLTAAEIDNIFYEPGRRYPTSGGPTIDDVPRAKPKIDGAENLPAVEKKTRVNAKGETETYFVFRKENFVSKPISRNGVLEPTVLFRGDSRAPEEIVNNAWGDGKGPGGLFGQGRNLDAGQHVFSIPIESGYVSATDKLYSALDFSSGMDGLPHDDKVGYVYLFNNRGSISKDFVLPGRGANEHEHLIVGGVPAEDIIGYIKVTSLKNGEIEYSPMQPMPPVAKRKNAE